MSPQILDGLLDDPLRLIDVVHIDGGKPHGQGNTAVRVPYHPDLEAKHGFQYFLDAFFSSPQLRRLLFGDFAAALASFGGFDVGGVQKRFHPLGEKAVRRKNADRPIEQPLQGKCANGLDVGSNRIGTDRPADGGGFFSFGFLTLVFGARFFAPLAGALSYFSSVEPHQPHQGLGS